jgi:hypothetical protein
MYIYTYVYTFSNFQEALTHFNHLNYFYIYIIIIIILLLSFISVRDGRVKE